MSLSSVSCKPVLRWVNTPQMHAKFPTTLQRLCSTHNPAAADGVLCCAVQVPSVRFTLQCPQGPAATAPGLPDALRTARLLPTIARAEPDRQGAFIADVAAARSALAPVALRWVAAWGEVGWGPHCMLLVV